jgi:hypothetical protein
MATGSVVIMASQRIQNWSWKYNVYFLINSESEIKHFQEKDLMSMKYYEDKDVDMK